MRYVEVSGAVEILPTGASTEPVALFRAKKSPQSDCKPISCSGDQDSRRDA